MLGGMSQLESLTGADEVDPWRRRCEITALACAVAASALVVGALLQIAGPFSGHGYHLAARQRFSGATSAGNGFTALFVVAAVLLIWLAPGEVVSRLGEGVVSATMALAVVVVVEAAAGIANELIPASQSAGNPLLWRI